MVRWDSTQMSIGDIRDLTNAHRLELRPDYQRKEVWTDAAKIMLIDSILKNIPMPKFYLLREVRGEATFRAVIDGQQRLRAILGFINNDFALKTPPCENHLNGQYFQNLESSDRDQIINYRIDMYEVTDATDDAVRQMYSRVNKYVTVLNKQELRRADFPGKFFNTAEELASLDIFDEFKIFTPANRRRMADIEFISELLALAIRETPLDKKVQLDSVYEQYMEWEESHCSDIVRLFNTVIEDCQAIFGGERDSLGHTRFHQKADFYALFGAICNLRRQGGSIESKDLTSLRADLTLLDENVSPSSYINILKEYAIRCVSDANSVASRRWRINFIENILKGTYLQEISEQAVNIFSEILYEILQNDDFEVEHRDCVVSHESFQPTIENSLLVWDCSINNQVFQMKNAKFMQKSLKNDSGLDQDRWLIVEPQLIQISYADEELSEVIL